MESSRPNVRATIVYYLIACAWSWPFYWRRDMEPASWAAWDAPGYLKTWTYMWGPAIAAFVCLAVWRKNHRRLITLQGNAPAFSLAFVGTPILLTAAFGLPNESGQVSHTWPLTLGLLGIISTFGEEMGWRGFLQDNLRPLRPWLRWVIIGVLWEAWHFTNRTHQGELPQVLLRLSITFPVVILLAAGIGAATERSKSILVAVTLHMWVNLTADNGAAVAWPLALSAAVWTVLLWKWPRDRA